MKIEKKDNNIRDNDVNPGERNGNTDYAHTKNNTQIDFVSNLISRTLGAEHTYQKIAGSPSPPYNDNSKEVAKIIMIKPALTPDMLPIFFRNGLTHRYKKPERTISYQDNNENNNDTKDENRSNDKHLDTNSSPDLYQSSSDSSLTSTPYRVSTSDSDIGKIAKKNDASDSDIGKIAKKNGASDSDIGKIAKKNGAADLYQSSSDSSLNSTPYRVSTSDSDIGKIATKNGVTLEANSDGSHVNAIKINSHYKGQSPSSKKRLGFSPIDVELGSNLLGETSKEDHAIPSTATALSNNGLKSSDVGGIKNSAFEKKSKSYEPETNVTIHIGRVEVQAIFPRSWAHAENKNNNNTRMSSAARPSLSLQNYLKYRSELRS
jgi:hypothetical protein